MNRPGALRLKERIEADHPSSVELFERRGEYSVELYASSPVTLKELSSYAEGASDDVEISAYDDAGDALTVVAFR